MCLSEQKWTMWLFHLECGRKESTWEVDNLQLPRRGLKRVPSMQPKPT